MIGAPHPASPARDRAVAYPFDPDFPQLEIATDPDRMLEIFRAHLRPAPGKACVILGCAPFRFRCRQSRSRCVLQYTLRLADPGTGRPRDQWVTGILYAGSGQAEKVWKDLRALDPLAQIPEAWRTFEPVSFIPELDMVVEVFPCDRRVPQLGRVLEVAAQRVGPLLLPRLGPGRWHAGEVTIEPARYRTEMGAALRCSITAYDDLTGRRATPRCFVKVYRNEQGSETYDFLQSWRGRPRAGLRYSLPGALEYWSDLRTLVLEEAEGTCLRDLILSERDAEHALRATARALAAFQQDRVEPTRSTDLGEHIDCVNRSALQVEWALPQLREEVQDIAATVASGLVEAPAAAIHGDLKVDHVFLSGERANFVDLDSVSLGDPTRDPAHFNAYLAARVGLGALSRRKARALAEAFADEYFSLVPNAWRRQFALHSAGALIEVACGIFRHQLPDWREQVAAAVEEARHVLSNGHLSPAPGHASDASRHDLAVEAELAGGPLPIALHLTELDLALMRALWIAGEGTARVVSRNVGPSLSGATVEGLLDRLEEKGVVARRVEGGEGIYRIVVGRAVAQRSFVENCASYADSLFDGDVAELVCQLLRARDVNPRDLGRVIDLLRARERELEGDRK